MLHSCAVLILAVADCLLSLRLSRDSQKIKVNCTRCSFECIIFFFNHTFVEMRMCVCACVCFISPLFQNPNAFSRFLGSYFMGFVYSCHLANNYIKMHTVAYFAYPSKRASVRAIHHFLYRSSMIVAVFNPIFIQTKPKWKKCAVYQNVKLAWQMKTNIHNYY